MIVVAVFSHGLSEESFWASSNLSRVCRWQISSLTNASALLEFQKHTRGSQICVVRWQICKHICPHAKDRTKPIFSLFDGFLVPKWDGRRFLKSACVVQLLPIYVSGSK